MVNSLENIDKSKVYVDRIEGLDEVVEEVVDNTLIGAVSTITKSDLTAGKVLVSDNNGKVAAGSKGINDLQDTLVSGTNIKTINGSSILGSGNLVIETGSDIDNLSITQNASSNLQAVGVINQNATTTAIKTWTGTKAQYDAITTKDNNILYHITDDESDIYDRVSGVINRIYPIGSIYLTVSNDNPATLLGLGLWTKVASGRVLQGSDNNHIAGTTIEAGLPNITGNIAAKPYQVTGTCSGAFFDNGEKADSDADSWKAKYQSGFGFDASLSNSIYGNSDTVQPPAFAVNIWQRVA